MRQAPDWLVDERRLERLAKDQEKTPDRTKVLQPDIRLGDAFDCAAVLMVVIFLGLLCWNWTTWTPANENPGLAEYRKAFFRALDAGPPPPQE